MLTESQALAGKTPLANATVWPSRGPAHGSGKAGRTADSVSREGNRTGAHPVEPLATISKTGPILAWPGSGNVS